MKPFLSYLVLIVVKKTGSLYYLFLSQTHQLLLFSCRCVWDVHPENNVEVVGSGLHDVFELFCYVS